MKEDSYVVIQAFMLNDLHLKGNELIVYATIYGFTQDGSHWFHGTRGYLAEWCGCTKDTAGNCLRALVSKGLIERRERHDIGQTFIDYRAVTPMKKQATPYEKTSDPHPKNQPINNLEDNLEDSSKDKRGVFSGVIDAYAETEELRMALADFIETRRQMRSPLTPKAMSMLLTKLDRLAPDEHGKAMVLEQSIVNGWKGVFPVKGTSSEGSTNGIPEYLREYDI